MTIPEACQLVLEAGSMGKGGEIFVFDMGKPVAISELAKKMIRLFGLVPEEDIRITYLGLRPGEKLYEELLADKEKTVATHHEKIMIAKTEIETNSELVNKMEQLLVLAKERKSPLIIISKIQEIVPEFISNNLLFNKNNI